jgi:3-deoxy-manno-octulosonate cytidylyltransferase (CMP-KDO synthetase)
MKPICIIPARCNSKRFPKKVIAQILGRHMFRWVYDAAVQAGCFADVWLAVDDLVVANIAEREGCEIIMTGKHSSGTERVFEAVKNLGLSAPEQVIVNLQCDEPCLESEHISTLCREMSRHTRWSVGTLVRPVPNHDAVSPNVVKAIVSRGSRVHYFTRSRLPHEICYAHIGVYAYRMAALSLHCSLRPSPNEQAENLEQLRLLDNGVSIHAARVNCITHAVDVPEDIAVVEQLLRSRQ